MATCLFCGEEKPLIDAHIIPRAFYPAKSPDGDTIIAPGLEGGYPKRTRTGVYDKSILCAGCDNLFGVFDQHVAERILRGRFNPVQRGLAREYYDAEPITVLRFAASLAWRASISRHDVFRTVKLGPYTNKIEYWLRDSSREIPFSLWIAEFDTDDVPFLNPHMTRILGVNVTVIYAGRMIFYVKLDQRQVPDKFASITVGSNRPVYSLVRHFESGKEINLMRKMLLQPSMASVRKKWAEGAQLPKKDAPAE